jgi:hypothetical protein
VCQILRGYVTLRGAAGGWGRGIIVQAKGKGKVKVKQSRYRPELACRVDRGIALPFCDLGARREWVVSTTPRPLYPRKDPVPIVQEAG